jgi:hypothetical protein
MLYYRWSLEDDATATSKYCALWFSSHLYSLSREEHTSQIGSVKLRSRLRWASVEPRLFRTADLVWSRSAWRIIQAEIKKEER